MKYLILILPLLFVGCKTHTTSSYQTIESNDEEPTTVEEYCEEYSSHLVPGSKKDSSYQGCINTYSDNY